MTTGARMPCDERQRLRAALEQLGGEASVQQLWVATRIDQKRIDERLRQAPWAERASTVSRNSLSQPDNFSERRWRLVAMADPQLAGGGGES
jgi:hypothetical protein